MKKPVKVFFDNCIFSHSIREISSLSGERDAWLINEIKAIDEINKMHLNQEIKVDHDANVLFEGRRRSSDENKKIREKWPGIRPGPTFVGFQGTMVNCFMKPEWEKRVNELKNLFRDRDKSLDVNHLVNAELYGDDYFLTTDQTLINKANNEGRGKLKVKVVSPSEFLKIYRAS